MSKAGVFQAENLQIGKKIVEENLDLHYLILYDDARAMEIFQKLETHITYYDEHLAKVKVFGKWHNIPRKQVAYGNEGIIYHFSGNSIPAKSWSEFPLLLEIKQDVEKMLDFKVCFNFVLINRYENGNDHIGEHRDNEEELLPNMPIASVSFGHPRDFILKHKDSRGKSKTRPDIKPIKIMLENGSLLLMNPPTNSFWYHSLPIRKSVLFPRINLTFRVFK